MKGNTGRNCPLRPPGPGFSVTLSGSAGEMEFRGPALDYRLRNTALSLVRRKAPLVLDPDTQAHLQRTSVSRTASAGSVERVRILLA